MSRIKPGDVLAWVFAVTLSALIVVFAAFLVSDWYRADFSRFERAMSAETYVARIPSILQAAIAVCIAAIPATFITRYFRSTRGDLEITGLGIKIRGPSGPILLWVASFLAAAAFIIVFMNAGR